MKILSDFEEKQVLRSEIADLKKRISNLENHHDPGDPFGLRDVCLGGDIPNLKSELRIILVMELAKKKNRLNELSRREPPNFKGMEERKLFEILGESKQYLADLDHKRSSLTAYLKLLGGDEVCLLVEYREYVELVIKRVEAEIKRRNLKIPAGR